MENSDAYGQSSEYFEAGYQSRNHGQDSVLGRMLCRENISCVCYLWRKAGPILVLFGLASSYTH